MSSREGTPPRAALAAGGGPPLKAAKLPRSVVAGRSMRRWISSGVGRTWPWRDLGVNGGGEREERKGEGIEGNREGEAERGR